MDIRILSMTLNNFKGIKDFEFFPNGKSAIISGKNGTGKTSVFDAWLWLLFDADSRGNTGADAAKTTAGADFVHKISHEVTATISVDNKTVTLRKAIAENWVKPRGKAEQEFAGNASKYWIDDVPMQLKDYSAYIGTLVSPDLFKIVSDPLYFSTKIKWQERLEMLVKMSGGVSEEDVAIGDYELERLLVKMGDKNFPDFKKMTQEKIRLLNSEISSIPDRIDECTRAFPPDTDFLSAETEISRLKLDAAEIERKELDFSELTKPAIAAKAEVFKLKQAREDAVHLLIGARNSEKRRISEKIQMKVSEIQSAGASRARIAEAIEAAKSQEIDVEKQNVEFRESFLAAQSEIRRLANEEFDCVGVIKNCPTCKQLLPPEVISAGIEKLRADFESDIAKKISELEQKIKAINARGISNKNFAEHLRKTQEEALANVMEIDDAIAEAKAVIDQLRIDDAKLIPFLEKDAILDESILEIDKQIAKAEERSVETPDAAIAEIRSQKADILDQISALEKVLNNRDVAKKLEARICELEADLRSKSATKIALEGDIYQCERFVRSRTEKLESKINGMFCKVGFKLFSEQVNGGLSETCEAIVNNTTFSKANTAGQINAGMDIIGAISKFHDVRVPVFVDRLESVNDLQQIKNQIIGLIVSKGEGLTVV